MKKWHKITLWAVASLLFLGLFYVVYTRIELEHKELSFYDSSRQRLVEVDMTIRKDRIRYINLPVAVVLHGNTGHKTDYSFLTTYLAAKGYLVLSIQTQNKSDPPMETKVGQPFVGRLEMIKRSATDIDFVLQQITGSFPTIDTSHMIMIGHSLGGDEVLYYAEHHAEKIDKVITLDNLRVKISPGEKFQILSFRSQDSEYRPDPGVLPSTDKYGITIVQTPYKHGALSDFGPQEAKDTILSGMEKFIR